MGKEFEATQVSCHVEAKNLDWIRPGPLSDEVWINGLFVRPRSIISSTHLRNFWVIRFAATLVSFLSFRSIDNRLALFFILFFFLSCSVISQILSSSTASLPNLLNLHDNASPSYSVTLAKSHFICSLIHLVHWTTMENEQLIIM